VAPLRRGAPEWRICLVRERHSEGDGVAHGVGRNVRIVNQKQMQQADGPNYVIREGAVVIPNGAVVPDGSVI
jgi:hypothetical protein